MLQYYFIFKQFISIVNSKSNRTHEKSRTHLHETTDLKNENEEFTAKIKKKHAYHSIKVAMKCVRDVYMYVVDVLYIASCKKPMWRKTQRDTQTECNQSNTLSAHKHTHDTTPKKTKCMNFTQINTALLIIIIERSLSSASSAHTSI